jgi:hypothetical protein
MIYQTEKYRDFAPLKIKSFSEKKQTGVFSTEVIKK